MFIKLFPLQESRSALGKGPEMLSAAFWDPFWADQEALGSNCLGHFGLWGIWAVPQQDRPITLTNEEEKPQNLKTCWFESSLVSITALLAVLSTPVFGRKLPLVWSSQLIAPHNAIQCWLSDDCVDHILIMLDPPADDDCQKNNFACRPNFGNISHPAMQVLESGEFSCWLSEQWKVVFVMIIDVMEVETGQATIYWHPQIKPDNSRSISDNTRLYRSVLHTSCFIPG